MIELVDLELIIEAIESTRVSKVAALDLLSLRLRNPEQFESA